MKIPENEVYNGAMPLCLSRKEIVAMVASDYANTPRIVAFVVSLLIMHIYTCRYLYLPLHTNTQGYLSPCSVASLIFRRTTYWPVRT